MPRIGFPRSWAIALALSCRMHARFWPHSPQRLASLCMHACTAACFEAWLGRMHSRSTPPSACSQLRRPACTASATLSATCVHAPWLCVEPLPSLNHMHAPGLLPDVLTSHTLTSSNPAACMHMPHRLCTACMHCRWSVPDRCRHGCSEPWPPPLCSSSSSWLQRVTIDSTLQFFLPSSSIRWNELACVNLSLKWNPRMTTVAMV